MGKDTFRRDTIRESARNSQDTSVLLVLRSPRTPSGLEHVHVDLLQDSAARIEAMLSRLSDDLTHLRNEMATLSGEVPDALRQRESTMTWQRHLLKDEVRRRAQGMGRADVRYLLAFHQVAEDTLDEDTMSKLRAALAARLQADRSGTDRSGTDRGDK